MNSRRLLISIFGVAALLLCLPVAGFAASTLTISPGSDGVFLVQGIGIEGAAAMEINIGYDLSTLSNPRVVEGPLISGAMTAVNPNVPGAVRIVVIRLSPISGSGLIATVSFDTRGTSGKITSLSVKLANSQGAALPAFAQISNPSETPATASTQSETPGSTSPSMATAQAVPSKTIIAGPSEKASESKGASDAAGAGAEVGRQTQPESGPQVGSEPVVIARTTADTPAAGDASSRKSPDTRKVYAQKSVLDRFREYKGRRSPEAFIALFAQDSLSWCRQEPLIALSDGRTAVRVRFISSPGEKTSSDVAVLGARLLSMKKDPDNTNSWIVDVVPKQGEYAASLGISQGDVTMICPLTTAPKISSDPARPKPMTREEFSRYVNERASAPPDPKKSDMNRDGKRDYIDDFIMTANYLAAAAKAPNLP